MKLKIVDAELVGQGQTRHHVYRIKGSDSLGEIDITRRYKEFFLFRECLFKRYPGLFIPPIPPKQATGNKEDGFLAERQYFLDQFLIVMSSSYALSKTPEIQVFLRPQGKVEESLKYLSEANTSKMIEFFMNNVKISSIDQQEGIVARYNAEIADFVKEQKLLMDELKRFGKIMNNIVPVKEREQMYYTQFAEFLGRYEEN